VLGDPATIGLPLLGFSVPQACSMIAADNIANTKGIRIIVFVFCTKLIKPCLVRQ
jgi:hypothetical protein